MHTHVQPLERTAIAGVDWPSGVLGFFNNGRFFYFILIYLFIYLFIYFSAAPCLGNYRKLPNSSRVSIKHRVQVYILINNHWFQINTGYNFIFKSRKTMCPLHVFCLRLLSVSQYHINDRHGSSAAKKLKVRLEIQTFCSKMCRGKLWRSSR